jgi:hypothetical protein
MADKNCISFWFPILEHALPDRVPKTVIIPAPVDGLTCLLDGFLPNGWNAFLSALQAAGASVGYPCFLRSGHTSAKHSWDQTCRIEEPEDFGPHVGQIVEFSECCGMIGLPYNVWAVREWLPGPIIGTAPRYRNMPVRREFRIFIDTGKIVCGHPYWPKESIEQGGCDAGTIAAIQFMNRLDDEDRETLYALVSTVTTAFDGFWSVDCLWTDRGWFVTDMALGDDSWHWPDCPEWATREVLNAG